jgi:hypothetical protein
MQTRDLKRWAKELARRGTEVAAARTGHQLVRKSFYSPMPDFENLPESLWGRPAETPGVDLRIEDALTLLRQLRPFIEEFAPPLENPGAGFFVHNGTYESVDAEVLYGIVRHAQPSRVVELGSGSSSHVIDAARRAGDGFDHVIYDPFPFTANPMGTVTGPTVHPQRTEDVDIDRLVESLSAGDVLFVDTTHTVKTGGDVTRIVLEIFPRLAPGVWVHVHDIFLPYEYPRSWIIDERRAWAEQYLLQAFLAFNERFEVMLPNFALSQMHPDIIKTVVPSFDDGVMPGGFWMRRVK